MATKARGIVVFDLDGTLLRGRTICEMLAEPLGRSSEMQLFEGLTTEPEIAKSRAEMASWYRGMTISELCVPLEGATWGPGVSEAVRVLRANGIEVAIASITWRFAVEWLAARIGVSRILGTTLGSAGTITHVWPRDKGAYVRALSEELDVQPQRIAAVGDSMNDQHLLSAASLRFFVGTGVPPPIPGVLHRPHGDILGIVREIIDFWADQPPDAPRHSAKVEPG